MFKFILDIVQYTCTYMKKGDHMLPQRLKYIRKLRRYTQEELAKKVNTTKGTISNYENGYSTPSNEMLTLLADALDTTTDFLLGRSDNPNSKNNLPLLTEKDEKDIKKDLEKILHSLKHEDGYAHFDGQSIEDMDEEDRELLIASLETSMRIAKQIAKKKFTPKKHRKN